jgi:hypothetical protein
MAEVPPGGTRVDRRIRRGQARPSATPRLRDLFARGPMGLMKSPGRKRAWSFAVALLAQAVACSPGGTPNAPPLTPAEACGVLFDALAAYSACGVSAPASPYGRRDRFVRYCAQRVAAPGTSGAVAAVGRCVTAIQKATPACGAVDVAACTVPPGTRAAGAPCGTAMQCASGYCVGPSSNTAEGAGPPTLSFLDVGGLSVCGVCVDKIALGQPCYRWLPQCGPGCTVLPVPCVDNAQCGVGCPPACPVPANGTTGRCIAMALQPPATPTVFDGGGPATTLVGPGVPCDIVRHVCQTGFCNFVTVPPGSGAPSSGTCPTVIPDGQPCPSGPAETCDTFAACVDPTMARGCCYAGGPSAMVSDASTSGDAGVSVPVSTCAMLDPSTCQ